MFKTRIKYHQLLKNIISTVPQVKFCQVLLFDVVFKYGHEICSNALKLYDLNNKWFVNVDVFVNSQYNLFLYLFLVTGI